MNINIKTLNGNEIKLHINESNTIKEIKNQIQEMEGINSNQLQLFLNSKLLDDTSTVLETNIKNGSVLQVILKLRC